MTDIAMNGLENKILDSFLNNMGQIEYESQFPSSQETKKKRKKDDPLNLDSNKIKKKGKYIKGKKYNKNISLPEFVPFSKRETHVIFSTVINFSSLNEKTLEIL